MKKGLVLPIAGIIMFVISVVAVYVLAQQDGNFTKEVIFKGEVAASNLNEMENIRKMLPMAMGPIGKRAAFESAGSGCGSYVWSDGVPTIDQIKQDLASKINMLLPTTTGDYARTISLSTLSKAEIDPTSSTSFTIKQIKFTLEDSIIKSKATSSIPATAVSTSYFKLYDIGQSLFTNAIYQTIINTNAHHTDRASSLKKSMFATCHLYGFTCDVQASSSIIFRITITDPNSLVLCREEEILICTNSMRPLKLTFGMAIPEYVPVAEKINPVKLEQGWTYSIKTPFANPITVSDATFGTDIDRIEGPDPVNGGLKEYSGADLLDPDAFYNVHTTSDCVWNGDYDTVPVTP